MSPHKIIEQSCSLGRFAVCSCGGFRTGYGDRAYVKGEVDRHLRTMGAVA